MATTHLALLFLLALAFTGAASGFYLPGVAPADFRKVLALFPPLFLSHSLTHFLFLISPHALGLCVCGSWRLVAERLARREGEPAELHQDAAALLLLLPPLLQAGHHHQQRREPRPGPLWRPNRELTLRGSSCRTAAVCTIIYLFASCELLLLQNVLDRVSSVFAKCSSR
jgi:hypothetical protein